MGGEIANVKISRAPVDTATGHVKYSFSFRRGDEVISSSVQLPMAYEERVGAAAARKYVRETYVK